MFLVKISQIFHFPHISSLNSKVTHTYIRSFENEISEMVATVQIAGEPVHRVEVSSMFCPQPPQPHHQQKTPTAASVCLKGLCSVTELALYNNATVLS